MLRLTLNTHFDFMIFCLAGRGTSFHVCIPMRVENSASAAFNHFALFGERRSCFHVRGVSIEASSAAAAPAQLPKRSGGLDVRVDLRVGGADGLESFLLLTFTDGPDRSGGEEVVGLDKAELAG